MKIIRITFAVLIFCLCAVSAMAQEGRLNETHDAMTKASVFIYSVAPSGTKQNATYPIYADEKHLANLDSGRYLIAMLDPGRHTFRSKDQKPGVVGLELKAGEVYYLRIEPEGVGRAGKSRLAFMPKDKGALEVRQLSPIKADGIKDRSLVVTDYNATDLPKPNAN